MSLEVPHLRYHSNCGLATEQVRQLNKTRNKQHKTETGVLLAYSMYDRKILDIRRLNPYGGLWQVGFLP